MKKIFTQKEFDSAKSRDKLPFECIQCQKTFYKAKNEIQKKNKNHPNIKILFCSKKCKDLSQNTSMKVECKNCNKKFNKQISDIKRSKNNFCSHPCSATYNNRNKKHGTRRSKLEVWLESQLTEKYPNLEILYNRSDAIQSELDIYIPSLSLAFELNGIFHYEPIYGQAKLASIQNNDERKFQACLERGIELCIIDTSHQKYFKEQTSKKFLNIITNIIGYKL